MRPDVPCLVVSLKRATERRLHIAQHLKRHGIDFAFVDAVDWRALTSQELRRLSGVKYSPTLGVPMAPGDIACTVSHGLAMQAIIDRGLSKALIFEDDAVLSDDFTELLEPLMTSPVRWDVLKFSGEPIERFEIVAKVGFHQIVKPRVSTTLAQGYAVTAAGARKLRPFLIPAKDCFDFVLQQTWNTGLELYEVLPRLVAQAGMPSLIARGRTYEAQRTRLGRLAMRVDKWKRSLWRRRQEISAAIAPRGSITTFEQGQK
jgi:glycosyl transferase family 25